MNGRVFLTVLAGTVVLAVCGVARADHPSVVFDGATAGPITTISAKTQPKGSLGVGLRVEQVKLNAFSDTEREGFAARGIHPHSTDYLRAAVIHVRNSRSVFAHAQAARKTCCSY